MTINRAAFNALVDDDGSNTIGSLWNKAAIKNVLLDPIDAAIPLYTEGNWTPIDASGAGLVFTFTTGATWVRIGRVVIAQGGVAWPATSNGAQALIGGLPLTAWTFQGGGFVHYTNLGVAPHLLVGASDTKIQLFSSAAVPYLNSGMSGKDVRFTVIYQVP